MGGLIDYLFAGLCVGLATAAAYSAAMIALLLIFSHGYYLHKRGLLTLPQLFANGSIIKAIYLAAIAFLCVTPYALIDPSKYLMTSLQKRPDQNSPNCTLLRLGILSYNRLILKRRG